MLNLGRPSGYTAHKRSRKISTVSLRSDDKKDYPTVCHASNPQVKGSRRVEISSKDKRADLQNTEDKRHKMVVCYT